MAQSELNRLLILPAIVLAAALSLSGCANLPFFGNDSDSSNNSSSRDDDDDEDEDEEEEDDNDSSGSSQCPQAFLDATKQQSDSSDFEGITVSEISPTEFEPASISDFLDGGCILVLEYTQDDMPGTIYEAFIPGSDDRLAELDAALVADGYDNSTESFYIGDDNSYVAVYSNEDSGFTQDQIDEQGMGFLGDEFIVITAYQGEV